MNLLIQKIAASDTATGTSATSDCDYCATATRLEFVEALLVQGIDQPGQLVLLRSSKRQP